jgi:hypothetical protein
MAFLLCLLTRRQTSGVRRVRHKAFDVPKSTKAKKLSGVSTRTSSGFVPGPLLWLERDLVSGRRSLTFTTPCFKPMITRTAICRSFTNTWPRALAGQREGDGVGRACEESGEERGILEELLWDP